MLVHWIWLATRRGVSARAVQALLAEFGDAQALYRANASGLQDLHLSEKQMDALLDKDLGVAYKIQRLCAAQDIRIMTWQDAAYPPGLRSIPDAPVVLYYQGTLPDLDETPGIAVVGTRKASAYGIEAAQKLGRQIAQCGAIVVSGIASGIDAAAMRGVLRAGGLMIGVLGCGADIVYPPENAALYEQTRQNGCILTEYPPGTPPLRGNFPRRNRIISGLSRGVLVIEAPEVSGALITARQAADQGRDVFVVPGNIDMDSCAGSNALLREGAIAVSSGWDVVSEYAAQYPGKLHAQSAPAKAPEPEPEPVKPPRAQGRPKPEPEAVTFVPIPTALSPNEQAVVAALQSGVMQTDALIAQLGKRPSEVMAALTMLEIKGIVRRLPGQRAELNSHK